MRCFKNTIFICFLDLVFNKNFFLSNWKKKKNTVFTVDCKMKEKLSFTVESELGVT